MPALGRGRQNAKTGRRMADTQQSTNGDRFHCPRDHTDCNLPPLIRHSGGRESGLFHLPQPQAKREQARVTMEKKGHHPCGGGGVATFKKRRNGVLLTDKSSDGGRCVVRLPYNRLAQAPDREGRLRTVTLQVDDLAWKAILKNVGRIVL